jgi:flagellar biosynthesis chaperone FliJ
MERDEIEKAVRDALDFLEVAYTKCNQVTEKLYELADALSSAEHYLEKASIDVTLWKQWGDIQNRLGALEEIVEEMQDVISALLEKVWISHLLEK